MSETNKGGGNAPKAGEQGFQKSKAGKKVPTASLINKNHKSGEVIKVTLPITVVRAVGSLGMLTPLIIQEELSILPTPAYLRKVPTASLINKNHKSGEVIKVTLPITVVRAVGSLGMLTPLIIQEELSILPTPAYLREDVLILGIATSVTRGKVLPGKPISSKDVNRSVRDVLVAQYADLRDKTIADARIRYSLPDTKKIMESRGYDAFFIARVKEDQLEYDITQADRAFKTNLLKVNKEYRTPWFKKSTVCQDCGKRDENITQHSCRDSF